MTQKTEESGKQDTTEKWACGLLRKKRLMKSL